MKEIIAVNGTIGTGKDTASEYFIERGYVQLSFAKVLKDVVSVLFNWDRELLEGKTDESREWRETPDEFWSLKFGREITPRKVLQEFGTDIVRTHYHNNMWVDRLELEMQKYDKIIISDCRFKNEILMLKDQDATFIEIQRNVPTWYNDAKIYNQIGGILPESLKEVHKSEYSWIGINEPDYVFKNNGTIAELHDNIHRIFQFN